MRLNANDCHALRRRTFSPPNRRSTRHGLRRPTRPSFRAASHGKSCNGYNFDGEHEQDIEYALNRALGDYFDRDKWNQMDLPSAGMRQDWSWTSPNNLTSISIGTPEVESIDSSNATTTSCVFFFCVCPCAYPPLPPPPPFFFFFCLTRVVWYF